MTYLAIRRTDGKFFAVPSSMTNFTDDKDKIKIYEKTSPKLITDLNYANFSNSVKTEKVEVINYEGNVSPKTKVY